MDSTAAGTLPGGWGEVSQWSAERIRQGDWTAAIWRSPELADAAARLAAHESLIPAAETRMACHLVSPSLATAHRRSAESAPGAFPILKSKGDCCSCATRQGARLPELQACRRQLPARPRPRRPGHRRAARQLLGSDLPHGRPAVPRRRVRRAPPVGRGRVRSPRLGPRRDRPPPSAAPPGAPRQRLQPRPILRRRRLTPRSPPNGRRAFLT